MTKKKELKEELLSKVSGGASLVGEEIQKWGSRNSNRIKELYKAKRPDLSDHDAAMSVLIWLHHALACNSLQEAKMLVGTQLGIDVSDLD